MGWQNVISISFIVNITYKFYTGWESRISYRQFIRMKRLKKTLFTTDRSMFSSLVASYKYVLTNVQLGYQCKTGTNTLKHMSCWARDNLTKQLRNKHAVNGHYLVKITHPTDKINLLIALSQHIMLPALLLQHDRVTLQICSVA